MSQRSQKEFSLKLLVAFVMILIAGLTKSFACSLQVDDNADKNMLAAHAVSSTDLSLTAVKALAIASFTRSFEDDGPTGSCPDYMTVRARISYTHVKSIVESCSYAVTVSVRSYMGEEWPEGPIQEVIFDDGEIACSTSQIRVPRKVPFKKKRIVKFPFPR